MTIMNATQTGPREAPHSATSGDPRTATPHPATGTAAGGPVAAVPAPAGPRTGDPRVGWSTTDTPHAPTLRHRRDGILPTVAAALSVRGATLTATAARGETPPALHPLVQDFLDTLTSGQRDRFTGRCAETILISRHLTAADAARSKRAARKPMTNGEARKALKHAKLTTRRIREDGDPLHGAFAHPCRACTALSAHFGVRIVDPTATDD
ncbi:YwqJ-related putative deaminase [Streptomyces griseosporeus]|uniref:YwqJ-related putative deaminase n=1 Tax=Streptomyces griseosporeus TaxID=1910 RepID=UPI0036CA2937